MFKMGGINRKGKDRGVYIRAESFGEGRERAKRRLSEEDVVARALGALLCGRVLSTARSDDV